MEAMVENICSDNVDDESGLIERKTLIVSEVDPAINEHVAVGLE